MCRKQKVFVLCIWENSSIMGRPSKLFVKDAAVEQVQEPKLLGVTLNNNLS